MKKLFLSLAAFTLFAGFAAPARAIDYAPLEPLPGLQNVSNINFPQFLGAIFKLIITAGAFFAVILLVWGGIMYILSGGGVEMGEAKKRIWAALYGFLILVGAWIMLYTINPTLLNFNLTVPGNVNNGNANSTQQSDINITAQNAWVICSNELPSTEKMNQIADTCDSQNKKVTAGQRVESKETSTSGVCSVYICQ
jgi:hypothetical protein